MRNTQTLKLLVSTYLLSLSLTVLNAQEALPFPPTPSASTAGLTMQTSTYKNRVDKKHLAEDAPNILMVLIDDAGPGSPMDVVLKVNGEEVAQGQVPITAPLVFTANDCLDFVSDLGSPVSLDYFDEAPFEFNGTLGTSIIRYPEKE